MSDIVSRIHKASLKFLSPLNLDDTYQNIVGEAVRLTGTKWGSIFLGEHENLVRVYTTMPDEIRGSPRKGGFTYRTYKTGEPFMLSGKSVKKGHPMYKKASAIIFVPLYYNNQPTGVLNLISSDNIKFDKGSLQQLQLFGDLASLAIRKAQLYNETKQALINRDLFLSIASHELKTPLTSIYIYVQLLHKKFADSKLPEAKWIKSLSQETDRLTNLVNEVLHVDQIKTGSLKYFKRKCSLRNIIERAISDSQLIYPDHNFIFQDLAKGKSASVNGDYDKLLQMAINLLNNAAKFSPPQTAIIISLDRKSPNIILSVKDLGKGIPKEEYERVFDLFYKGEKSYREGMGLGLYLVKHIVEKHHGEIKFKSELDKGSTFEVKLLEAK